MRESSSAMSSLRSAQWIECAVDRSVADQPTRTQHHRKSHHASCHSEIRYSPSMCLVTSVRLNLWSPIPWPLAWGGPWSIDGTQELKSFVESLLWDPLKIVWNGEVANYTRTNKAYLLFCFSRCWSGELLRWNAHWKSNPLSCVSTLKQLSKTDLKIILISCDFPSFCLNSSYPLHCWNQLEVLPQGQLYRACLHHWKVNYLLRPNEQQPTKRKIFPSESVVKLSMALQTNL